MQYIFISAATSVQNSNKIKRRNKKKTAHIEREDVLVMNPYRSRLILDLAHSTFKNNIIIFFSVEIQFGSYPKIMFHSKKHFSHKIQKHC